MTEGFDSKIFQPGRFKQSFQEDDPYFRSLTAKYERIPTRIFGNAVEGSLGTAKEIAEVIREKNKRGELCVLALSAESGPLEVCRELVLLHQRKEISFRQVVFFAIMEYYPLDEPSPRWMKHVLQEKFLRYVDIPEEQIFFPDGTVEQNKVPSHCQEIEKKINTFGGIDILLLGLGRTGRIGFNEPGASRKSLTRPVSLDDVTRTEKASEFFGKERVPRKALTLGIQTLLAARMIRLLVWGEEKAALVKKAVEERVGEEIPASFLQEHPQAAVILDMASAAELTRISTPWLIDQMVWDDRLIRKAVVWLSRQVKKPVLKLTDRDYNDHGMENLITEKGVAYNINIKVFNDLQHTITGWPGGKPQADDTNRPERKTPFPKRILIFSPHPDDDVISMGGTMLRLVEQGHDVHVAYQCSGNVAVSDADVLKYMDFIRDFIDPREDDDGIGLHEIYREIGSYPGRKNSEALDPEVVRRVKTLIRAGEAKAACRYVGLQAGNVHFLNMPFYETGGTEKRPPGTEDIRLVTELIARIKPHQIYAAGDLSDPHGTHRICLETIFASLRELREEEWLKDCWVWLYRGAWQEWEIHQIEMAVPLSPDELLRKRTAIFKHQSQKDGALFLGDDTREFWQRAEGRNRGTAKAYDDLGLAEYEAVEAFVRYELSLSP
ncbi:MAG: glucosamine-6-phosphate deaminase [Spirochaetales bacterium]|nr:glucosamine-6-phosphate deaminase [Spirochaetales bacterium]